MWARVRRILLVALLVLAGGFAAASSRDFGVSGEAAEARLKAQGIYHPRSIADAILHLTDMSTYLYHEARCGHMDGAEAGKLRAAVIGGVERDFPGWDAIDDAVLRFRLWQGRRSVDDISCAQVAALNAVFVTDNIGYYSSRQ